ncbi:MAG: hypothetical protein IGS49_04560 [Chlorogloeopsis fritschii C42_A2020_084]|nr:hypothetical protein [Chlorogloeopsis fritschii C42_A2020_084]
MRICVIAFVVYDELTSKTSRTHAVSGLNFYGVNKMVTLSDDEVALIRSILTALRAIKVRDIDKALVILSKGDKGGAE